VLLEIKEWPPGKEFQKEDMKINHSKIVNKNANKV